MSICILADAADFDGAKTVLEYMSVDDLEKYVNLFIIPVLLFSSQRV